MFYNGLPKTAYWPIEPHLLPCCDPSSLKLASGCSNRQTDKTLTGGVFEFRTSYQRKKKKYEIKKYTYLHNLIRDSKQVSRSNLLQVDRQEPNLPSVLTQRTIQQLN